MNDLHFAFRQLRKNPGFTAVAVLTLALGIGANTTVFSLVNSVLLRPLPFPDPERLVFLDENNLQLGFERLGISYADYLDWRRQNQVFEDLGLFGDRVYTVTGGDHPERVQGAEITASLFALLGIQPVLGRAFTPDEDRPAAAPVALLGHGLWQRRFGAAPDIVGQTITLDGHSHTIVGVMPPGFAFQEFSQLWTPLVVKEPESQRGSYTYAGVARLKPGVTVEQARVEMSTIAERIAQEHPRANASVGVVLRPLRDEWTRGARELLWLMLGAVGFVLAVACANVANLCLARATTRQKEFALRAALGASQWRTTRQLLVESLLLGLIAGALGLALARWGLDLVLTAVPPDAKPYWMQFTVDPRVLGFTLACALATSVVFGLAPAWGATRRELNEALKEGGHNASDSRERHRLRAGLVVAEVALAVVLLSGAGLTITSFLRLQRVEPGFNPDPVLVFNLTLPSSKYPGAAERTGFYRELTDRLAALPSAKAVAGVSHLPIGGGSWGIGYTVEGQEATEPANMQIGNARVATPGYFRAMEIPLLAGRDFTEADRADAAQVAVIDATFARHRFPNQDPLGKRIKLGGPDSQDPWMTIVGVAGDVKHYGLDRPIRPGFYLPQDQLSRGNVTLVMRTAEDDPLSLAPAVRRVVSSLDSDLPVYNLRTLRAVVEHSYWPQRLFSQLFTLFSVLGLALAAVGIYSVIAYSVAKRTHEIGVRMALGARAPDVLRLVIRRGVALVGLGLGLGIVGNLGVLRLLASQLYGVSPTDVGASGLAVLVLSGIALLACWLPARRASKVDPVVALRYE
jgi:putative ABC transport system permease protein